VGEVLSEERASAGGTTVADEREARRDREVGIRLRRIRTARRKTLRTTAADAGITEGFLSQIERGMSNPSLATLRRIAGVFGLRISDLFDDFGAGEPRVLRPEDRPVLHFGSMGTKVHLTPDADRHLDVFVWEFEPRGSTGLEPFRHGDSEEFMLVMSGSVTLDLADRRLEMRAGDSIVYRSSTPHRIAESAQQPAQVLWAMTPPSL
jgi:transcriptional regulator with XRE-family HTH domain